MGLARLLLFGTLLVGVVQAQLYDEVSGDQEDLPVDTFDDLGGFEDESDDDSTSGIDNSRNSRQFIDALHAFHRGVMRFFKGGSGDPDKGAGGAGGNTGGAGGNAGGAGGDAGGASGNTSGAGGAAPGAGGAPATKNNPYDYSNQQSNLDDQY